MVLIHSVQVVCSILLSLSFSSGFIFDKLDCQLSPWTLWSSADADGLMNRHRVVIRQPTNGGLPCPPDTTDSKSAGIPNLATTADSVINNFLRPRGVAVQGRQIGVWRDLLIILDSSKSITRANFDKAKYSISRLLKLLCPSPDPFLSGQHQAAMIEFSTTVRKLFGFKDYNNTHDIQSAILRTPYMSGTTCTATAFHESVKMFTAYQGSRVNEHNIKKEVLILTDGESNCGGDAYNESQTLQATADVYSLVIGTPSPKGQAELESYVTGPLNKHLFAVKSFQDLEKLIQLVENQTVTNQIQCAPFEIGR